MGSQEGQQHRKKRFECEALVCWSLAAKQKHFDSMFPRSPLVRLRRVAALAAEPDPARSAAVTVVAVCGSPGFAHV
jgi:hypothetical protein